MFNTKIRYSTLQAGMLRVLDNLLTTLMPGRTRRKLGTETAMRIRLMHTNRRKLAA